MEHTGTVTRLNVDAGFGYVRVAGPDGGTWIFVVERALSHRVMRQLSVGAAVQFDVDGRGRVLGLVPAQDAQA